jgi:hypothetical protein
LAYRIGRFACCSSSRTGSGTNTFSNKADKSSTCSIRTR